MTYLDYINQNYPIRNRAGEKEVFRAWAMDQARNSGWDARVECNEKHNNLVIGDPERAQILFTAHYDTPRRSLTPNLILPTNRFLFWVYNIGISLVLVLIALMASSGILAQTGLHRSERTGFLIWYNSYIVLFLILFKLVLFGSKNRHNCNDNTSGTAAVLELMKRLKGNENAAFILFDDEEKGKKGSKAFSKAHGSIKENKPVINLDCVANGAHFIISAAQGAQEQRLYPLLKQACVPADGFDFAFYDAKRASMNSDQKSFRCGIGVCACHQYRLIGYCTPRIHTKYDTVASNANIDYLTDALARFAQSLEGESL